MSMPDSRHGRRLVLAVAGACLGLPAASSAAVISGTVVDRVGAFPYDLTAPGDLAPRAYEVGDGVNHVTINPQFASWFEWETSLWFYGSALDGGVDGWHDTDIALVLGVTDISLITDASAYTFTNGATPEPLLATDYVPTASPPDGWVTPSSGLVLLRNNNTGHYGAVIYRTGWDFIGGFDPAYGPASVMVELEWYFQTDGSGDFSSIPAPGAASLLGVAGALCARRRRR